MLAETMRSERLLRGVYALCLLAATGTHVTVLVQHGIFWNYGGVSWFSAAFWTSLTLADPVAAACLFLAPRLGLSLTTGIIVLDVLHNAVLFFAVWPPPADVPVWSHVQLGLQVAFLLFVSATVRIPWSHQQSRG